MHLDAEQIQRAIDGEPLIAESATTRAHLAECATCRAAVQAAAHEERALFARLGALDNAPRRVQLETVRANARRPHAWRLRWVAMLFAGVGLAGATYALPYPALRAWLQRRMGPAAATVAPPPINVRAADPDVAGVAVAPGASTLVAFTSRQSRGEAHVVLTDGSTIEVRAPAGSSATYAVGADGITISNAGAVTTYEIRIPRTVLRVEVRVAGVSVWRKDRERTVSDHVPEADGITRIPLRQE